LARSSDEKTPAQLARSFHVTRGAMSNTLNRLDHAGYIHIRPDWDDARRKFISINGAGRHACDQALAAITPILAKSVQALGPDRVRAILPVLRELRVQFETNVPD
jgi:DNA-binding MarR family transcriptional regulator